MASETLLLLQLEHRNFADLLDLMDEQVMALDRGDQPDGALLKASVDYFSNFLDECHHPKEDRVYQKLVHSAPRVAERLSGLIQDHRELTQLTRSYAAQVNVLRLTGMPPREALRNSLHRFIEYHRDHIAMEEEYFYPAALRHLSRDDWAAIDFASLDHGEFRADDTRERFRALQDTITRLGQPGHHEAKAHGLLLDQARTLALLSSVRDFNAWLKQSRVPLRMLRYGSGEYGLEDEQDVILAIPECPEQQAVWCAYYFIAGYTRPD